MSNETSARASRERVWVSASRPSSASACFMSFRACANSLKRIFKSFFGEACACAMRKFARASNATPIHGALCILRPILRARCIQAAASSCFRCACRTVANPAFQRLMYSRSLKPFAIIKDFLYNRSASARLPEDTASSARLLKTTDESGVSPIRSARLSERCKEASAKSYSAILRWT